MNWPPLADVFRTLRKPIKAADVLLNVVQRAAAHELAPAAIRTTTRRTISVRY
jgi:hypothetical protein